MKQEVSSPYHRYKTEHNITAYNRICSVCNDRYMDGEDTANWVKIQRCRKCYLKALGTINESEIYLKRGRF